MTAPTRINGYTGPERRKMCRHKNRYADEHAARAAGMISLEQHNLGYSKLWPYQCPLCSRWHLTKKYRKNVQAITLQFAYEPEAEAA
jgi:hypothetical protein